MSSNRIISKKALEASILKSAPVNSATHTQSSQEGPTKATSLVTGRNLLIGVGVLLAGVFAWKHFKSKD